MNVALGIGLCILAGVCVGTFLLPLKLSRRWAWENSWLISATFMFLIFPLTEAWFFVPAALPVLRSASVSSVVLSFVAGIVQGTAALVFTYGVTLMGVSLGYSVMMSMIMFFGTMIPLWFGHPNLILKAAGLTLMTGVGIVVVGAIIAAIAGERRGRFSPTTGLDSLADGPTHKARSPSFALMALIGMYVGVTASLNFFVLEFESGITQRATTQFHVSLPLAPFVVLLPWYMGNFVLNFIYCVGKMNRDRTLANYVRGGGGLGLEYLLAVSIGVLWYAGQGSLYLAGFQRLGSLGVPVGAALFMGSIIVTSNLSGLMTKEWDRVPRSIARLMYGAVAVLLLGIAVVGVGNYLAS
jgi:L-rhamnose-H+ transport protein